MGWSPDTSDASAALRFWRIDGRLRSAPHQGLINHTWLVGPSSGAEPAAVLQWVSPVIDARANVDIAAVTERLARKGLELTPTIIPTHEEQLSVRAPEGFWRLLSYVAGHTTDTIRSVEQAESVGRIVGRFHAGLHGWTYSYEAPPRRAHETDRRMESLRRVYDADLVHPLASEARSLADEILARWTELGWSRQERPLRHCHGDLKITNFRISDRGQATALLDLDTVGAMEIDSEMGDAWRSWCASGDEFDLELFAASARGWLSEVKFLEPVERTALVPSIERISLELAARFCLDSVQNTYFRENRERYPLPGDHNLRRALSQLALAMEARAARPRCEHILAELLR